MAGKRIFMTGASGYIGGEITRQAVALGYTVHGLVRSDAKAAHLTSLGGVPVQGDLNDASVVDVLRRESAAADIVMHLAHAMNFGEIDSPAKYEGVLQVDSRAVDAITEGLASAGNVSEKVLVTTTGSLVSQPDPAGGLTDETAPGRTDMPFDRQRSIDYAYAQGKAHGIRTVAIRVAPWVFGRAGSGVALFLRLFYTQAGALFYIDDGSHHITTVHVDDLARLYLLAAERGIDGHDYNGTNQTDVTFRQLAEAMAKAVGLPAMSMSTADATGKFGSTFAWFLSADNRASNARAKRELGWEPAVQASVLEDIATGSYVALAEELKKQKPGPAAAASA